MSTTSFELIVSRRTQIGATVILDLKAADDQALPRFEAGAHLDLHLAEGVTRQYSLCSDPQVSGDYRLGILVEAQSRGGSARVQSELHVGQTVRASGPRNHFPLQENAKHSLLIGGGIGITPVIAMAWRLHHLDASFELHYCARNAAVASFTEILNTLPFADRIHLHLDDGAPEQRFAPAALAKSAQQRAQDGAHLYVCGPNGFMDWVVAQASDAGLPKECIHLERFSADVDTSGNSFKVRLAKCGREFVIGESDTIAEVLLDADIPLEISCAQGVCGVCVTRVLEGIPDHRDVYFMDDERASNEMMTPCCSRSKTPLLVLDL